MNHKRLHVKGGGIIASPHHRSRAAFALMALAMSVHTLVGADNLEIASGERFDGSLVNIRNGTLSFRTALAGRIFVPVDEVRALRTASFVAVTIDDRKLLPGRIETVEGAFYMMNPDGRAKTPLPLERISRVDRIPESKRDSSAGDSAAGLRTTSVTAETGYRGRLGTEDGSGPFARIGIEGETERLRFNARADVEYNVNEDAADRYYDVRGGIGIPREGLSPEVQIELKRDTNRALEDRTDIVAGARSTLLEDEEQTLSGFAGLGVSFEDWDPAKLRSDQNVTTPLPGDTAQNDEDLNLNLQLRYSRHLFRDTQLMQRLSVLPSLTDDDFRASLESQLSVPLALRFRLRLGLILDYDNSSPYQRIDDWTAAMEAGLSIDF